MLRGPMNVMEVDVRRKTEASGEFTGACERVVQARDDHTGIQTEAIAMGPGQHLACRIGLDNAAGGGIGQRCANPKALLDAVDRMRDGTVEELAIARQEVA